MEEKKIKEGFPEKGVFEVQYGLDEGWVWDNSKWKKWWVQDRQRTQHHILMDDLGKFQKEVRIWQILEEREKESQRGRRL